MKFLVHNSVGTAGVKIWPIAALVIAALTMPLLGRAADFSLASPDEEASERVANPSDAAPGEGESGVKELLLDGREAGRGPMISGLGKDAPSAASGGGKAAAFIFIFSLAAMGTMFYYRKKAANGEVPAQKIKVVSCASIGKGQRIIVIDVNGSRLLIGATDRSVNLLQKLENDAKAPALPSAVPATASSSRDAATATGKSPANAFEKMLGSYAAAAGRAGEKTARPRAPGLAARLEKVKRIAS